MPSNLFMIKFTSILLIFVVAIMAGFYPFLKKKRSGISDFPMGQALASGVFLGAGLIHMLGDASSDFIALNVHYPMAFLIAGATFLVFLGLEHIGREFYEHDGENANSFAIIAFVMLSIHSLFAGAALGLSDNLAVVLVLLIAILAHKWAAAFALATQIAKSHLASKTGILLFVIFSIMTPLGIYAGDVITNSLQHHRYIEPVFNSIAAGTFLYLGTLHGLARSFMIDKCCNLKNFVYVIVGFVLMAAVAVWT